MKLNFGCGSKFSDGWINIDFHSDDPRVRRVNLLSGFPFPDASMEAVYSSHVLEHFDPRSGKYLMNESFRILRKEGILRIVVPDLEGSCKEYLQILSLPDSDEKRKMYGWIIIELLDQMVRTHRSGEMGAFINRVSLGTDNEFKNYLLSRTESGFFDHNISHKRNLLEKIANLSTQKIATKLSYLYLDIVSYLIPPALRSMVFIKTDIGERHRWMYDEYSLKLLFEECGFSQVHRLSYNESGIADFNSYCLDITKDGQPYKRNSIFMEGIKA